MSFSPAYLVPTYSASRLTRSSATKSTKKRKVQDVESNTALKTDTDTNVKSIQLHRSHKDRDKLCPSTNTCVEVSKSFQVRENRDYNKIRSHLRDTGSFNVLRPGTSRETPNTPKMSLNFATTGGTEKKKRIWEAERDPTRAVSKSFFSVILAMDVAGVGAVTSVYQPRKHQLSSLES